MGTTNIDVIQTQQINDLQNDVVALKDEVNKCVSDITELRNKIVSMKTLLNTVRTEVEDIDDLITKDNSSSSGYSSSSNSGNGILKKIKLLEDACSIFMDNTLVPENSQNGYWQRLALSVNPSTLSVNPDTPLGTYTAASTSNETDPASQTSSSVSVTGVYSSTTQKVVTIQDDSATRAREVARSTLTKLRDL